MRQSTIENGLEAGTGPALWDRDVYFFIESRGYSCSGGSRTLKVARGDVAELARLASMGSGGWPKRVLAFRRDWIFEIDH